MVESIAWFFRSVKKLISQKSVASSQTNRGWGAPLVDKPVVWRVASGRRPGYRRVFVLGVV